MSIDEILENGDNNVERKKHRNNTLDNEGYCPLYKRCHLKCEIYSDNQYEDCERWQMWRDLYKI